MDKNLIERYFNVGVEASALFGVGGAKTWLHFNHAQLEGKTPKAAMIDGQIEDVERILQQLASGAFV